MSDRAKAKSDDMPAVMPYLGVREAAAAIEFYRQAFGAKDMGRLNLPDGRIAHAAIDIGGAVVMLADENPEWGNFAPPSLGGTTVRLHLYVDAVDAVFARAIAAGAKEVIPVADQFYGDRSGRLEDPFGHQWIVATRKEEVAMDEMQRRFEEMAPKTE
ncbi:MAG TPA: VOC family protein [Gemmatimonadota bacterium]|nr:VOC family protein [Gemmatimonadota bacterium]